ncbi:MAG: hypothetical protein Q7R96_01920 [Nanoarchaeota archaeon]|nr:hypothetical protein [Nanoarchaeota archaeon]
MARLWFKAKCFGWGWFPCSWEGWVLTLVFLVIVVYLSIYTSWMSFLRGWFVVGVLTGLLIGVCWLKGERPRWRWG